jgi:hypothetical protein
MTPLLRLLAIVLWHAGFAPSERIERRAAAITYVETRGGRK